MRIYVVMGRCGEYSDHMEWMIVAYTLKSVAQAHVIKATERMYELYADPTKAAYAGASYPSVEEGDNAWDPNMSTGYTGTSYYIEEVELHMGVDALVKP